MSEILKFLPSSKRGYADYGWLKTNYSFSFAEYYNPLWMGFSSLRVINEDHIAPGGTFSPHHHKNAEIMTYVLSGRITHEDNMANSYSLGPGEFQFMSAGRGVIHSESNKGDEDIHLLQIWIMPNVLNTEPFYKNLPRHEEDKWCLLASNDPDDDEVPIIKQNAQLHVLRVSKIDNILFPYTGRLCWMQLASGAIKLMNRTFTAGDGIGFIASRSESIIFNEPSTLLLFGL